MFRIVRRILNALDEPFSIEGHPVRVRSSIGVALSPEHGADVDAPLRCADIALYQAKHTGLGLPCTQTSMICTARIALRLRRSSARQLISIK